ncbi:hypothetical protein WJ87_04750 [Burkholderia ubonensis]|nr:hypothetical protein WJ87_04750 [Burkholderia ubonensis]
MTHQLGSQVHVFRQLDDVLEPGILQGLKDVIRDIFVRLVRPGVVRCVDDCAFFTAVTTKNDSYPELFAQFIEVGFDSCFL